VAISEFINFHLLDWCRANHITFTRSRRGNKNDGCHVEQKNWTAVCTIVGYHRYDTFAELFAQPPPHRPRPHAARGHLQMRQRKRYTGIFAESTRRL